MNSLSSSAISAGARTEVGSSRMSTRAPRQSCFTISTRCCAATPSVSTGASTSRRSPVRSAAARTSLRARSASRTPNRRGSRPSTTFSQTRSGGTSRKCWWTAPMPAPMAARGSPGGTSNPDDRTVPESCRYRPQAMFTRVDFPAPFSPTSARTSPASTERETSSTAATPAKRLVMPCNSSAGSVTASPRADSRSPPDRVAGTPSALRGWRGPECGGS